MVAEQVEAKTAACQINNRQNKYSTVTQEHGCELIGDEETTTTDQEISGVMEILVV